MLQKYNTKLYKVSFSLDHLHQFSRRITHMVTKLISSPTLRYTQLSKTPAYSTHPQWLEQINLLHLKEPSMPALDTMSIQQQPISCNRQHYPILYHQDDNTKLISRCWFREGLLWKLWSILCKERSLCFDVFKLFFILYIFFTFKFYWHKFSYQIEFIL